MTNDAATKESLPLCARCGEHHTCYACGVVHDVEEDNPNCNPDESRHQDCDLHAAAKEQSK